MKIGGFRKMKSKSIEMNLSCLKRYQKNVSIGFVTIPVEASIYV
jgi:hypothetical protein